MAINVIFEGYVNEVKQLSWGTVVKMSHSQRGKNPTTGEWETTGKDYIDVTLPEGGSAPAENSVVSVTGTLKIGTYIKKDGTTGVSMNVRAKEIAPVQRYRDPVDVVAGVMAPLGATEVDTW